MARAIGGILGSIAGRVIGAAVAGPLGAAVGSAIGAALGSAVGGAIAGTQRVAKRSEQAIKTERPPRVRGYGETKRQGASMVFETVDGTTVDVWAFHDGRTAAITRTYLNDDQVQAPGGVVQKLDDGSYGDGKVRLGYSLGAPTETAFAAVTALIPDWDATCRGDGITAGYLVKAPVKDTKFLEVYPQGDNVVLSLVGRWTPTFDPRDPVQDPYDPETWTWSANAVRAFVHYLMTECGFDWAARFEPVRAMVVAAIDDADAEQPLAVGGTEPRYRTALTYSTADEPASVINSLLACFDGWYMVDSAGHVLVRSGRYYAPTVSLGPDQVAAFTVQSGVADEDRVNTVAVPYVSALHDFGQVDGQPWTDEDDITTRGREVTGELGAQVPSHTQGRRLAKRVMARANAPFRGTLTTTFAGRAALYERYIDLHLEEGGAVFFSGPAEVTGGERNAETGGATLTWIAADPNIDAWNPATEDGEGAPVKNRYAPAPLDAPAVVSATATFSDTGYSPGDGLESDRTSSGARVLVAATGPIRDDVTWYARWRVSAGGTWNEQAYPDADPGPGVSITTGFVPLAANVQVAVAYRVGDGRLSPYSAAATVDTRPD